MGIPAGGRTGSVSGSVNVTGVRKKDPKSVTDLGVACDSDRLVGCFENPRVDGSIPSQATKQALTGIENPAI